MREGPVSRHVRLSIRRLRMERGLRIRDLAERAGIPLGSYSCLESGRYRISTDNLFRILHALGAPIEEVWPAVRGAGGPVKEVSERYIRKVLAKARQQQPELPSVEDAVEAVCRVYGLTLEELSSPSRRRRLCEARTVAAMLIEGQPHLSKSRLGRLLQRGPSTLTHCARRLKARLPSDQRLAARIEEARRLFSRPRNRRRGGKPIRPSSVRNPRTERRSAP